QWLLDNTQILAIIDMQRDLFQPRNDTQTSMVMIRRLSADQKAAPQDYPMFMAVTDKIGHDKRGNALFKRDVDGTDILAEREIRTKSVEGGKVTERVITELQPVIDDQLQEIPVLYRNWKKELGL